MQLNFIYDEKLYRVILKRTEEDYLDFNFFIDSSDIYDYDKWIDKMFDMDNELFI